jgi:hypothetical protein
VVTPVAAAGEIVIEAVTLVLVGVPVIEPPTPALFDTTPVAPDRLVPVKVTGNVPMEPDAGLTDRTAIAALTVKGKV